MRAVLAAVIVSLLVGSACAAFGGARVRPSSAQSSAIQMPPIFFNPIQPAFPPNVQAK